MRMKRSDQVALLEKVPLFKGLSQKHLGMVATSLNEVSVDDGTELTRQGEPGDAMYLIASGKVVVRRNGRKIAERKKGDFIGEMALLDGQDRSATVVADGPVTVFEVHRKDFIELVDQVPGFARTILAGLSHRLREAESGQIT
jgi:CRP-like cAMP-binding protein